MLEAILGILFEGLGEVIIEIFGQLIMAVLIESIAQAFRRDKKVDSRVAAFGLLLLGAICGGLSCLIYPHRLVHVSNPRFRGLSLVLAPLGTGTCTSFLGAWLRSRDGRPTAMATFWGGATFAFAMALVRWLCVGRI